MENIILNYSNQEVINRYSKENNVDLTKAKLHFEALKKFLILTSKKDTSCYPDKTLDNVWHTFILYTKDYKMFCEQKLGKFIHHNPFTESNREKEINSLGYCCKINPLKEDELIVDYSKPKAFFSCGGGGDCSSCR